MKKKLIALILTGVMCASVLAGCGSSGAATEQTAETEEAPAAEESEAEAPEEKDHYVFGYSPSTMNNPYFI